MPIRFYLPSTGTAPFSPAFDSNWEQTGQAVRLPLVPKPLVSALSALTDFQVTVPITTTQDILTAQFVSLPLPEVRIEAGRFSLVIRCSENANTNNAHLAYSLRIINDDGTVRATLASSFATVTEFSLTGAPSTRIFGDGSTTIATSAVTTERLDRLVLEVGVRAVGPTAAGSAILRFGNNAASDFALTSALTTDLNPWMELAQVVFPPLPGNFQYVKVGDGMSTVEKIR